MEITNYTPKTKSLQEGLRQLPDTPNDLTQWNMLRKVYEAELRVNEAKKMLEEAQADFGENLDGEWTFDEIRKTGIRGNAIVMGSLRKN